MMSSLSSFSGRADNKADRLKAKGWRKKHRYVRVEGDGLDVLAHTQLQRFNWELFKLWKSNRSPSITGQMARDFFPFLQTTGGQVIKNHYDFIATAPTSANRCPNRYCVYDLSKAICRMTQIPFVAVFTQETDKVHHGRLYLYAYGDHVEIFKIHILPGQPIDLTHPSHGKSYGP